VRGTDDAMSRHENRQKLALESGATDIVTQRGDEGVARIKDLTEGVGADAVPECVGTQESMMPANPAHRRGTLIYPRPRRHHGWRLGDEHSPAAFTGHSSDDCMPTTFGLSIP